MTNQEFSDEFDVLYNNIMSNQAPGLDDYEKSVFLTKAQDEIVKSYFSNVYNKAMEGYDRSEKRQYDFSSLVRVANLFNINSAAVSRIDGTEKLDRRSEVFLFPIDYFLSVNEVISDKAYQYSVIPLEYEEYRRLMLKPYAYPVKKAAWRLITDKKNCNYYQEYVPGTQCDYTFLSTWADQKRNLNITIRFIENYTFKKDEFKDGKVTNTSVQFKYSNDSAENVSFELTVSGTWDEDTNATYNIILTLAGENLGLDDAEVIETIKYAFTKVDLNNPTVENYKIGTVAKRLDKCIQMTAPGHFENFVYTPKIKVGSISPEKPATYYTTVEEYNEAKGKELTEEEFNNLQEDKKIKTPYKTPVPSQDIPAKGGKTFITSAIEVPFAEVIGIFKSTPSYQIRYIKKLRPVILKDLDDGVSIGGSSVATTCMLPSELHHEVLQRAVELAKAAYTGNLSDSVSLGQMSATEKGIITRQ